jgi:hypothetical protein
VDSRRYNEVQFRDARVVHQQSDTAHSTRTRVTTPTRQANQRTQRVHEGKLRLGCNSCNQFGGRRSADVVVPRKHDVRGRLKLAQRSDRFPTRCTGCCRLFNHLDLSTSYEQSKNGREDTGGRQRAISIPHSPVSFSSTPRSGPHAERQACQRGKGRAPCESAGSTRDPV